MRNLMRIKTALCIVMATVTVQMNAQRDTSRNNNNNSNNRNNKKTTTTNNRRTVSKVVPRSTVKYKTAKKRVTTYRNVPNRSVQVKGRNNNTYHYDNNRFYRNYNGRYISVAPRPGIRINRLPVGYRTVRYGNRNFFNFGGIFYINVNNQYEVVRPEVGTIVYELPRDVEKIIINGDVFYEFNDVVYEKIQYNGSRAYEVVGIIE